MASRVIIRRANIAVKFVSDLNMWKNGNTKTKCMLNAPSRDFIGTQFRCTDTTFTIALILLGIRMILPDAGLTMSDSV
ncbi:unnamed protein product [Gordionus sp. m RMFG-2023]